MIAVLTLWTALAAEAPKPGAPGKAALAGFQGKWRATRHEHGGKALPAKEVAALTLEVTGARVTVREGDRPKEETTVVRLDARARPAAIDLEPADGKAVRGIWKIDGDTLTVCVAEPGKARPTEFAGKEGTGHTLLVFRRVKDR